MANAENPTGVRYAAPAMTGVRGNGVGERGTGAPPDPDFGSGKIVTTLPYVLAIQPWTRTTERKAS